MTDFPTLLEELFSALKASWEPMVDHLQPGLTYDVVSTKTKDFPFVLPKELYELYMWRNGSPVVLFDGFYWLSLDDALAEYQQFSENDLWYPGKLEPSWFPILANLGGDFYMIRSSPNPNEVEGKFVFPIIEHTTDSFEAPVVYQNLFSMIATITECFSAGAFITDPDGRVTVDEQKRIKIARKHNPNVAYWPEWFASLKQFGML